MSIWTLPIKQFHWFVLIKYMMDTVTHVTQTSVCFIFFFSSSDILVWFLAKTWFGWNRNRFTDLWLQSSFRALYICDISISFGQIFIKSKRLGDNNGNNLISCGVYCSHENKILFTLPLLKLYFLKFVHMLQKRSFL